MVARRAWPPQPVRRYVGVGVVLPREARPWQLDGPVIQRGMGVGVGHVVVVEPERRDAHPQIVGGRLRYPSRLRSLFLLPPHRLLLRGHFLLGLLRGLLVYHALFGRGLLVFFFRGQHGRLVVLPSD